MITVAVALSMGLSGCATQTDASSQVKAALLNTQAQARKFHYVDTVYSDQENQRTPRVTTVDGVLEDDLRFQAAMSVNGSPVYTEMTVDDARAMQVQDPATFNKLVADNAAAATSFTPLPTPSASPNSSPGTSPRAHATPSPTPVTTPSPSPITLGGASTAAPPAPDAATLAKLGSGAWVADDTAASVITHLNVAAPPIGTDPARDSLSVLQYALSLVDAPGAFVTKFNAESLDYSAASDPFPKPDASAGEVRYDLQPTRLPPRGGGGIQAGKNGAQYPDVNYFRNFSVYVRNGQVVSIRESISVLRRLQDPREDLIARFQDQNIAIPTDLTQPQQAYLILLLINQSLKQSHKDLIRPRDMVFTLSDLGAATDVVTLPDKSQTGVLAGILPRGQFMFEVGS